MQVQLEHPAGEIKRLQRSINDLVSLLALPAMWTGSKPSDIVHTLLDSLLRMLDLDFVYVSLTNQSPRRPPRRSGSLNRKNRCSDRGNSIRSSMAGWEMTHKNVIYRNGVTLETKRFHSCPGLSGFSVKSGNRSGVSSSRFSAGYRGTSSRHSG